MIIKHLDGSYEVIVRGQDTERYTCSDEEQAIRGYRNMYAFMNNCKPEEVKIPRVRDLSVPPEVVIGSNGGCQVEHEQIQQALDLALYCKTLKPGYRYRLSLELTELDSPAFMGDGI